MYRKEKETLALNSFINACHKGPSCAFFVKVHFHVKGRQPIPNLQRFTDNYISLKLAHQLGPLLIEGILIATENSPFSEVHN